MRIPNKLFEYEESIVALFPIILNAIESSDDPIGTYDLFKAVNKKIANLNDFITALDALYGLHKIELSKATIDEQEFIYVKIRNA